MNVQEEWHTALELSFRMPPFGKHIVGSPWRMGGCAWTLSEMDQMVCLVKLADVLTVIVNLKIFTYYCRIMGIFLLGY